ncbi:MAG: response regulator, partial [Pseudomonadales bacterium]|nr:response regulator [Pseudomonadales bacterium]
GTGLGLAICRRLVESMHGELRLTSVPGLGSDFIFDIPLQPVKGIDGTPLQREIPGEPWVLLIEDSRASQTVLRRMLESWKVRQVHVATTAAAAMSAVLRAQSRRRPYDIILLDNAISESGCLPLVEAMRNADERHVTRIVVLISIGEENLCNHADAILRKPVLPSELYNRLLELDDAFFPAVAQEQQHAAAPQVFGGRRVLLAEDNPTNQEVAQAILSRAGFAIDICENGSDALRRVQQDRYDAVLMDIQMPVMDGLESTRRIRQLGGRYAELPIIAMTAHALTGDREKSLEAGMNGHVTKPINPEVLFTELARWVAAGEAPAPANVPTGLPDPGDEIPDLPGIDLPSGLARINGNWPAYRRILQNFARNNAGRIEEIEALLVQGDLEAAARLAHALKGSGGNIAADALHTEAAELERLCRAGARAQCLPQLQVLAGALRQLLDSLVVLDEPEQATGAAAAEELGDELFVQRMAEIRDHLEKDFSEAQASFERVASAGFAGRHRDLVNELEAAMRGYDIDSARKLLQKFFTPGSIG